MQDAPMLDASSMHSRIGPHLPFLRRYARALSGSQVSGDNLVRAVLEALVEAPDMLAAGDEPKVDLFRLFHDFHSRHETTLGNHDAGGLPHPLRHALLLTAVEGFSIAEAARILGRAEADVEQGIAAARAAIAELLRSRVLIIEDEPIIAMHLEQLVEEMGHSVIATAMTRKEAVAEALANRPDLVLADIQLADGSSGIDAANDILVQLDVPVIFITAYPERLLTGERPEPAYLVTKPFEPATVIATVGQALLARHPGFAPAG